MVRISDRIWNHVEKTDEVWKCRFCDHVFAKGIAAQIVKCHLAGVGGPGTKFCSDVPGHVKMEARREINEGEKKRRIIMSTSPSSSSNVTVEVSPKNDGERMIEQETILRSRDVGVLERESDQEMIEAEFPAVMVKNGDSVCEICWDVFERRTTAKRTQWHLAEIGGSGDTICTSMPDDVKGAILQRKRRKTMRGSTHTEDVPTMSIEDVAVQPLEEGWSGITKALEDLHNEADHGVRDEKMVEVEDASVMDSQRNQKFVGVAFQTNKDAILSTLMNQEVSIVGVWGVAGVGKTTLMRHIYNELPNVYWVTASYNCDISGLQNLIAEEICLDLSDYDDVSERAAKLFNKLSLEWKCVIILDGLWQCFYMKEVGIPVRINNACKVVFTTRSQDVCRQMGCSEGNMVQVRPLSVREAWFLFTRELGNYEPEVEQLAKDVSRECAGLPLGIRVLARTMRGITDVWEWKDALEELRKGKFRINDKDKDAFHVLKFSYVHLRDSSLQQCFLYCALLSEYHKIELDKLIVYLVGEGVIDEQESMAIEFDKVCDMLNRLENVGLLDDCRDRDLKKNGSYVKMHDLIRDMAIQELRANCRTLVEVKEKLKELPDVNRWTTDLVRVSLMDNDIEKIFSRPRCPNLTTLLLGGNKQLKWIADSFFEQLDKLKVLDLSFCIQIEFLPDSISDLVNLTTLLLSGCEMLSYMPSLVKLSRLKTLDLSRCKGLRETTLKYDLSLAVTKLNYLDLSGSGIRKIPSGITPKLSGLQLLKLIGCAVKGRDVGRLVKLETLECRFKDVSEWMNYLESRARCGQSLSKYFIHIGGRGYQMPVFSGCEEIRSSSKKWVVMNHCYGDSVALPPDVQALMILNCHDFKDYYVLMENTTQLQESNTDIRYLMNFRGLRGRREEATTDIRIPIQPKWLTSFGFLPNLKTIHISGCHSFKRLFPPNLLPNLHNLESIHVSHCRVMEEIFAMDEEDDNSNNYPTSMSPFNLPNLTFLVLCGLPELRSIYNGMVNCHSLKRIELVGCPKVNRIPLQLPQPNSLQSIRVYPQMWESLQWDNPIHKNNLQLCI